MTLAYPHTSTSWTRSVAHRDGPRRVQEAKDTDLALPKSDDTTVNSSEVEPTVSSLFEQSLDTPISPEASSAATVVRTAWQLLSIPRVTLVDEGNTAAWLDSAQLTESVLSTVGAIHEHITAPIVTVSKAHSDPLGHHVWLHVRSDSEPKTFITELMAFDRAWLYKQDAVLRSQIGVYIG